MPYSEPCWWLHCTSLFLSCSPDLHSHPCFLSSSAQNQEAEPLKGQSGEQPTRGDVPSTGRVVLPGALWQVPASTRPHHAVPAEGHRARHHLRWLRQQPARHLHTPHDNPEQAGWPTGHLCCQVGQISARLVDSDWGQAAVRKCFWAVLTFFKIYLFIFFSRAIFAFSLCSDTCAAVIVWLVRRRTTCCKVLVQHKTGVLITGKQRSHLCHWSWDQPIHNWYRPFFVVVLFW